jgi:hypothetical protein
MSWQTNGFNKAGWPNFIFLLLFIYKLDCNENWTDKKKEKKTNTDMVGKKHKCCISIYLIFLFILWLQRKYFRLKFLT